MIDPKLKENLALLLRSQRIGSPTYNDLTELLDSFYKLEERVTKLEEKVKFLSYQGERLL